MRFLERLFWQRPRVLNQLHRVGLVSATSQTSEEELEVVSQFAAGAKCALEIGTYQGVSAARIARALDPRGRLFCIDPWPEINRRPDPCREICERHLRRTGTHGRIEIIRGWSADVRHLLPSIIDFAFIDGDHSWAGIETDWRIVSERLRAGGIVCLHDTARISGESRQGFDSERFFAEVIATDPAYGIRQSIRSLNVVQRVR